LHAGAGALYAVVTGFTRVGVGSNGIHPQSGKYTSTQLWALLVLIEYCPVAASRSPVAKPTTTREGIPSLRSMTAIAVENCWQNPALDTVRKSMIDRVPPCSGVSTVYVN